MSDLYTDDDRARARDALGLSRFMGCDCCAEQPVCDHGESFCCDVCEAAGIDPPDRIWSLAAEVLDAVLPAYQKRLLNELADEILDDWDGDIHSVYAADWLRAKAEETP